MSIQRQQQAMRRASAAARWAPAVAIAALAIGLAPAAAAQGTPDRRPKGGTAEPVQDIHSPVSRRAVPREPPGPAVRDAADH